MSEVVLDASALIAMLRNEPGQEVVRNLLGVSLISTVNAAEVYSKAVEIGIGLEAAIRVIDALPMRIIPFDRQQAIVAGSLREVTRSKGLSLGDRCCLALGLAENLPVLTTEKAMAKVALGIEVRLIR